LANLLANKIKGKYRNEIQIMGDELDALIKREVQTFVDNKTMHEKNLIELDEKISALVDIEVNRKK
jgi:hypothetical protein